MKRSVLAAGFIVGMLAATSADRALALFHQWNFSEFFSNADGSVQFIELLNGNFNSENIATAGQIRSMSTGNVYQFPTNLPSSQTANKRMFVATDGFESLPGASTPDFAAHAMGHLPPNFFNPAGDTISLVVSGFGTVDSKTFTSLPTDGVMSLNFPPTGGTQAVNSPTNFAGDSGSVNLAAPNGDYNGNGVVDAADYVLWRDTLTQSASPAGSGADGNASGTIDDGDYTFWRARFGNTVPAAAASAASAIPEPMTSLLVIMAACLVAPCRRR